MSNLLCDRALFPVCVELEQRSASMVALGSVALSAAEYNSEVLQQSEYYLTPDAVKDIIAAEQLLNTKDAQRVFVCYGRSSVELGEIWLHSSDTYKDGVSSSHPHLISSFKLSYRPLLLRQGVSAQLGCQLSSECGCGDEEQARQWLRPLRSIRQAGGFGG